MDPTEPNASGVEFLGPDVFLEYDVYPVKDPEELKRLNAKRRDPLALRRIDHVRFFVGNARQSAYFYRNAFGFDVVAYAGLETGVRREAGYVLRQGQITFVLTSPLTPDHPENFRLMQHGDGVMDIALEV